MTRPAHAYRVEVSERSMALARRRVNRRYVDQAQPVDREPVEEHWHPLKVLGVAVFMLAFLYALTFVGAVMA